MPPADGYDDVEIVKLVMAFIVSVLLLVNIVPIITSVPGSITPFPFLSLQRATITS